MIFLRMKRESGIIHIIFILLFVTSIICVIALGIIFYRDYARNELISTPLAQNSVSKPWVRSFSPLRTFYVSPSGTGAGHTMADPMSLRSAVVNSMPGDLYYLLEGEYVPDVAGESMRGTLLLSGVGTEENPIVYRAFPGHRAVIMGNVSIGSSALSEESGKYNWVWGLEITDPQNSVDVGREQGSGLVMFSEGSTAINNIIHDQALKNGIGAWGNPLGNGYDTGTLRNHVVYGNIVYRNGLGTNTSQCNSAPNHNVYGHHSYADDNGITYGYRYFVDNIIFDAAEDCGKSKNILMRSSAGEVSGFYLDGNVIFNGGVAANPEGRPSYNMKFQSNWLVDSHFLIGGRPFQGEIIGNTLINTVLEIQSLWGNEPSIPRTVGNTVVRNNKIYSDTYTYQIITAIKSDASSSGQAPIRSSDVWDYNVYGPFALNEPHFRAGVIANGRTLNSGHTQSLEAFRQATRGIRFSSPEGLDASSSVVGKPASVDYKLIRNVYDQDLSYLVVYNWSSQASVTLNLQRELPSARRVGVYSVHDMFGSPVVAASPRNITIPLEGDSAYSIYVVRSISK